MLGYLGKHAGPCESCLGFAPTDFLPVLRHTTTMQPANWRSRPRRTRSTLFGSLGWHTVKLALRISRIEAAFEMVSTFHVELRRFAVSLYRLLNKDVRGQAMIE